MEELSLFPKINLVDLDKLGIDYSVVKDSESWDDLCTISVNKDNYDEVYKIGWHGWTELIRKGE